MDLYTINFQGTEYLYCSSNKDVEYNNKTYLASSVSRTEISSELKDSEVRLSVPITLSPFHYFVMYSPSSDLTVSIIDYSSGFEYFIGILTKVSFNIKTEIAEVTLKRKEAFFDSEVPYRTYGTTCSFILYSTQCGVLDTNHSFLSSVFTISNDGRTISVPELLNYTSGVFTSGYLLTNTGETAYIVAHTNTTLSLDLPLINSATVLKVIKGCNKTLLECQTKYNNNLNFGGFPFIPSKNPVTESI